MSGRGKNKRIYVNPNSVQYDVSIQRVLKQVAAGTGLSGEALGMLNALLRQFTCEMMCNLVTLTHSDPRKTLSARMVQATVRLTMPGELAKHAISEGSKAVGKYNQAVAAHKAGAGGGKKKAVSRGTKAGLQFPVARVEKTIMQLTPHNRKSASASVYFTAVLEYLCAEILELSNNAARDRKKKRISTQHISLAIFYDEELRDLFKNTQLPGLAIAEDMPTKTQKKKDKQAKKAARKAKKA